MNNRPLPAKARTVPNEQSPPRKSTDRAQQRGKGFWLELPRFVRQFHRRKRTCSLLIVVQRPSRRFVKFG